MKINLMQCEHRQIPYLLRYDDLRKHTNLNECELIDTMKRNLKTESCNILLGGEEIELTLNDSFKLVSTLEVLIAIKWLTSLGNDVIVGGVKLDSNLRVYNNIKNMIQ